MQDHEHNDEPRRPRYHGEDTSPTSQRELLGWYMYGLAAEVFAVCGVGSFLPVTLEQLIRERGFFRSDPSIPCVSKSTPNHAARHNSSLVLRDGSQTENQCVVHLFGKDVSSASLTMYTFSCAVLVQGLVFVSFSSVADHGHNRKSLLLAFGFTGAISSMLFMAIVPKIYFLGCLLVVVGVTCLGSSFVVLNSFLPLLVSNHPSLRGTEGREWSSGPYEGIPRLDADSFDDERVDSHIRASNGAHPASFGSSFGRSNSNKMTSEQTLSAQISSKGVGIGYAAAVLVQIFSIGLLLLLKKTNVSSTLPMRLILFLVGLWWFVFTLVTKFWLRPRPGPPLESPSSAKRNTLRLWLTYVSFAWRSLWSTVKIAVKLRQVAVFLVAWFLLSDAIATVSATAILFAKVELHMETTGVALLSITATVSGILGAFTWPLISKRFNLRLNHTILGCIFLFELIPLYGLLAYIPFVQKWGVIGLQKPWEIYPLGVVHGFVMGGLSSYCRSFYGLLIPPASEAAFYTLYAITDKGSAAVGPTVVGAIVDATGSIRPAFGFLAVLIVLPAPLIWLVDVEKGKNDALLMAEVISGRKNEVERFGDEDGVPLMRHDS